MSQLPPRQSNPHPPDGIVEKPTLKPVSTDPRFWLLVVCNIFAVMTVMMTFVHQLADAINNGIAKIEAAAAIGLIGIMGSGGKFFFGWLSDRIRDAKYLAALGFLLMAVGMYLRCRATNVITLYMFALFFGFGYGSLAPVTPDLISDRFGGGSWESLMDCSLFFPRGSAVPWDLFRRLHFRQNRLLSAGLDHEYRFSANHFILILALKPKPKEG